MSYLDYLPDELLMVICLYLPISDVLNLNLTIPKIFDDYFWIYYLNKDQDKIHDTLVYLSKTDNSYYMYLYNIIKKSKDMMVENRTLVESFKSAVHFNHFELAHEIYNLNITFLDEYFFPSGLYEKLPKNYNIEEITKYRYLLEKYAKEGNKRAFNEIYNEVSKMPQYEVDLSYITDIALSNAKNINFIFYVFVLQDRDINDESQYEDWFTFIIESGRLDLVKQIAKHFGKDWMNYLESYGEDALTILMLNIPKGYKFFYQKLDSKTLNPNILSHTDSINNPDILRRYIEEYPTQISILLGSFRTLPSNEYIELIKKYVKCLSNYQLKEFLKELKKNGYDYLVKVFKEDIKIC